MATMDVQANAPGTAASTSLPSCTGRGNGAQAGSRWRCGKSCSSISSGASGLLRAEK
jgi:hypothetical protein